LTEDKENSVSHESQIYLCAPVNALVEGIYKQNIPVSEIKKHGDFGLGTFNDLDGEMVMLDGNVYQITHDGNVNKIEDDAFTPFVCVTFYKPLTYDDITHEMSSNEFTEWMYSLLPSQNLFYAFRIDGLFAHIKARSVPKQECYRPLVEVSKEQSIFDFQNLKGTLAGFYTPSFMSSLNVPGLHLHFLSTDLKCGGHMLECRPQKVRVGVQFIGLLELALPISLEYLTHDFKRDMEKDLNKIEKQ
jgi:acetolactate decarboxylase